MDGFSQALPTLPVKPKQEASKPKPVRKLKPVERPAVPAQAKLPDMVVIEGGTFSMGSTDGEYYEKPLHQVTLNSFSIGKYEVTFDEYDAFCNATGHTKPSDMFWGRGNHPVIEVSWKDAAAYCNWLSNKTGKNYRLPTEAEWEYAARGGNKSKGYTYSGSNSIDNVGWYLYKNSSSTTHPVGQKQANELGLYDMTGNLREWCSDWYDDIYYSNSPTQNPQGPASGTNRVLRGGSWNDLPRECSVTDRRHCNKPDYKDIIIGFRIACSL